MASNSPLIVITGMTASGKSSIALDLAEKWGGEIICADSRTVYKGMDIGTAKPTLNEQKRVKHWLLDIVEPTERFTVVDFQEKALASISDIRSRGKIPFIVGGTGLYIDAVILDFVFTPDSGKYSRQELEYMTIEELKLLHHKQQIKLPENEKNKRYLVRNIEKYNTSTSGKSTPNKDTFVFAIDWEKELLRQRIERRIEEMFSHEVVRETQQLVRRYGAGCEAMTGNIYRVAIQLASGLIDEESAKKMCATLDWRLAKRQKTWLKRHSYVRWLEYERIYEAVEYVIRKYRDD